MSEQLPGPEPEELATWNRVRTDRFMRELIAMLQQMDVPPEQHPEGVKAALGRYVVSIESLIGDERRAAEDNLRAVIGILKDHSRKTSHHPNPDISDVGVIKVVQVRIVASYIQW